MDVEVSELPPSAPMTDGVPTAEALGTPETKPEEPTASNATPVLPQTKSPSMRKSRERNKPDWFQNT